MAHFDLSLMVLFLSVAVVGSFLGLVVMRDALLRPQHNRRSLVILAVLCFGGVGVWSMHFIGLLACDFNGLGANYNAWLTALSFYVGVGAVYVGLTLMASDEFGLGHLAGIGNLVGLGIVGMHYLGVLSMRVQAQISWNFWLVAASVVMAIAAAMMALWLVVHVRQVWQMFFGSVVVGVALCTMHLIGLFAAGFTFNSGLPVMRPLVVTMPVFSLTIATLDAVVVVVAIAQILAESNKRKFGLPT